MAAFLITLVLATVGAVASSPYPDRGEPISNSQHTHLIGWVVACIPSIFPSALLLTCFLLLLFSTDS